MKYSLRVCPTCDNELFGIAMVDGHPYYYCPRCGEHFLRWELLRVQVEYNQEFKRFEEVAKDV